MEGIYVLITMHVLQLKDYNILQCGLRVNNKTILNTIFIVNKSNMYENVCTGHKSIIKKELKKIKLTK